MDWSLGNIIGIGMRALSNRAEIQRVVEQGIAQINAAEKFYFSDLRPLIAKIAPDLLVDLHVAPAMPIKPAPTYDVRWVQEALNHILHPAKIKVDGIMGERTREAIKDYQSLRGLPIDGWLGPITMSALDADIREAHARTGRA